MSSLAVSPRRGARAPTRVTRVLGVIGEPLDGVGYVRFAQPFKRLRDRGFELATLGRSLTLRRGDRGYEPDPALLDGVSLLIFPQMVASPVLDDGTRVDVVASLCREAARRGIPVVYSVDDYLPVIERHNPAYERIRRSIANLDVILEHAAAILVTTEPLRQTLAPLGKPIHLLPNTVDPGDWTLRPAAGGVPRVGWTGSSSHLEDLLMVAPAMRELQRRVDCRFVIQGLTDMPFAEQVRQIRRHRRGHSPAQREVADRFMELIGALDGVRYEHLPFAPTGEFFELLPRLDLDIGICPLLDSPFNRHKSANKFYEYAVTGSMTVASRVTPYAEEVSVTVPDDPAAWSDVLERYLREPATRASELERQRAFVLAERNIEGWRQRWAEVLDGIRDGARRSEP